MRIITLLWVKQRKEKMMKRRVLFSIAIVLAFVSIPLRSAHRSPGSKMDIGQTVYTWPRRTIEGWRRRRAEALLLTPDDKRRLKLIKNAAQRRRARRRAITQAQRAPIRRAAQ